MYLLKKITSVICRKNGYSFRPSRFVEYKATHIQNCNVVEKLKLENSLFNFHGKWPDEIKTNFKYDMKLQEDFISELEESDLLNEIEPHLTRLRYEFDHWDDAIHGYREIERKCWYPQNKIVLDRVIKTAFDGSIMPYIHVLDLAEDGFIKPHVDSERFCGNIISGISLLSDSVMRLVFNKENTDFNNLVDCKKGENSQNAEMSFYVDLLLPRRSLYIMRDTARYNFTHEILGNDVSKFRENPVHKNRRISIICRNEPQM